MTASPAGALIFSGTSGRKVVCALAYRTEPRRTAIASSCIFIAKSYMCLRFFIRGSTIRISRGIVTAMNLALPRSVSRLRMMSCSGALAIALLFGQSAIGQQQATSPDREATASQAKPLGQPPSAETPDALNANLSLTPGPDGKLTQSQMQSLFRVVADKDIENDKRQRDYTYIERQVQHTLDSKGKIKSTEIKTYEVLEIYGEQVERLIAKDDKPLSAKEAAKEEEKIQKIIDKHKNESDADRKKREEKAL